MEITINTLLLIGLLISSGVVGAMLTWGLSLTKEETKEDTSEGYSNLSEEYNSLKEAYNAKVSESYETSLEKEKTKELLEQQSFTIKSKQDTTVLQKGKEYKAIHKDKDNYSVYYAGGYFLTTLKTNFYKTIK